MRTVLTLVMVLLATGSASGDDKPIPKFKGKELGYWIAKLERPADDKELAEATEAVKAFGPDATSALPKLMVMLEDKSDVYRRQVFEIITEMKSAALPAVPAIVKRLKEKTATDPHTLLMILGNFGPPAGEAATVVAEYLGDERCGYSAHAALCAFGSEHAKPHADAVVRAMKKGTGPYGFPLVAKLKGVVVPSLLKWLDEKDCDATDTILGVLAEIGPEAKAAIPTLKKLLLSTDQLKAYKEVVSKPAPFPTSSFPAKVDAGFRAAIALARIEPAKECLESLIVLVETDHPHLNWKAAGALGAMGKLAAPALPALGTAVIRWSSVTDVEIGEDAISAIKKAMAEM